MNGYSDTDRSVITAQTVSKVAKLARLELDDEEQKVMLVQMGRILAHFEKLSNISESDAGLSGHPYETENKLRDDQVLPGLPEAGLTGLSASHKDGYLQVPRTLE
jgi:aspartyl-tRNA(Asn)/glutamyl-tRNA(Gln) amidotransferase subunit C